MRRFGTPNAGPETRSASADYSPSVPLGGLLGSARALTNLKSRGMMESERRVFYVRREETAGKWVVTEAGDESTRSEFESSAEAVEAAKKLAQAHGPSRLLVHKTDGSLDYETTYDEDPLVTELQKFGF